MVGKFEFPDINEFDAEQPNARSNVCTNPLLSLFLMIYI